LDVIFTERFHTILKRGDRNILNLLSCGALANWDDPRNAIKKFASQYVLLLALRYKKKSSYIKFIAQKII